jgi:hypothetical protein
MPHDYIHAPSNVYPHLGIRKAIVLARYYALLKKWIVFQRAKGIGLPKEFTDLAQVKFLP